MSMSFDRLSASSPRRAARLAALAALALFVAACAGPRGGPPASSGGGYYMDDGPGRNEPADVALIADAVPREEPIRLANTRPYEVFGQRYIPMRARAPYRETGVASWYGRKFHGNATASGERYDMYAMTAAHRTLPLPSYVRVTNLSNGRSVVVRVNDRGPFMKNRLIDLSWTAAKKLDFIEDGHARVRVELILPGEGPAAQEPVVAAAPPAAPVEPVATADSTVPIATSAIAAPSAGQEALAASSAGPVAESAAASSADDPPRVPRGFVLVGAEPARVASPMVNAAGAQASPSGFVRVGPEPEHVSAPTARRASTGAPADASPAIASQALDPALYLQLGAFRSHDSAMAVLSDLGRRLDWLGDALSLHAEDGQYKVQAGPWVDLARAEQAAARIRAEARIEPFTVRREAAQ